jgi:hypothetical protein
MNNLQDAQATSLGRASRLRHFAARSAPVAVGLVLGIIGAFLLAWLCGTPLPF